MCQHLLRQTNTGKQLSVLLLDQRATVGDERIPRLASFAKYVVALLWDIPLFGDPYQIKPKSTDLCSLFALCIGSGDGAERHAALHRLFMVWVISTPAFLYGDSFQPATPS